MPWIEVKMPSGQTRSMDLREGGTVRDVKMWAASQESLVLEDVVVKCGGRCLEAENLREFVGKPLEVTLAKKKSMILAYFFWFIGWWCGLHHWYLEREGQAFLWMTSLGGFGIGSAFDFFFIPGYVSEANGHFKKGKDSTSFGFWAFLTYLLFATYYTWLLEFLGEWPAYWAGNFIAMACLTFGRRTIGIPSYKGIGWLMITQVLIMQDQKATPLVEAGQSFVRRAFGVAQRRRPDDVPPTGRKSLPLRGLLFLGSAALVAVTSHYIEFEYQGKQTTLAESFVSGGKIMQQLFQEFYKMGPRESFDSIFAMVHGEEKKALRVLGLEKGATTQEIKKAWRKKTFEFHPDRNPDAPPGVMNEINQAYETLNRIYKLRGGKSEDDDSTRESPEYKKREQKDGGGGWGSFSFSFGNKVQEQAEEAMKDAMKDAMNDAMGEAVKEAMKEQMKKRPEPTITEADYTKKLAAWTAKAAKRSKDGKVLPAGWHTRMKSIPDIVGVLMARKNREKDEAAKKEVTDLIEYLWKAQKQRKGDDEDEEINYEL